MFATLEPELQMAGYFGQSPPPAPLAVDEVPVAARSCGDALIQRLDLPVEVAPAYELSCAARGGGAVSSSAQLTVRRASAQPAAAALGRAQWLGSVTAGQLVWNDTAGALTPADTERRDLLVRVYYVARASDGDTTTPALRVKSLSSVAGVPAFMDTEVMPGVEAIQAELLPAEASRAACASRSPCVPIRPTSTNRRCGGSPSRASSRCAMHPRAEGFAVLVMLALLAVIGLYTAATLQSALFSNVLAGTRVFQQRAFLLADLGIERGLQDLAATSAPADYTRELHPSQGPATASPSKLRTTAVDSLPAGFSAGRFVNHRVRDHQHRHCAARRPVGPGAGRCAVVPAAALP